MADSSIAAQYHWQDSSAPPSFFWNFPTYLKLCRELGAKRVLDLGCGNGAIAGALAKEGFSVVGCDYDAHGVEVAAAAYPGVKFAAVSSYDPPAVLGDLNFDVVISAEVIEHCFKPREVLKFAREALKPKGHLVISTPYHGYIKNLALSVFSKWDYHHMVWEDGGHIKFFSPETLDEMLEEEGFVVKARNFVGRLPYLWKGMIFAAELNPDAIPAKICTKCGDNIPYPADKRAMFAKRDGLCPKCYQ